MIQEDERAEAKVQPASKSIKDWAEEDRPREKLLRLGPQALSKAELLAILIGSGTPKESAVSLMQRVLGEYNQSLHNLERRSIEELCGFKGIGEAKAITIMAACELARRRESEKVNDLRESLSSGERIFQYMRPRMGNLGHEEAWVLLMNNRFQLIKDLRLSSGGLSDTSIDVRKIIKEALLSDATIVALCHNHPSGNLHPSADDDQITAKVKKACDLMRIHFVDHVIITDGGYYSYRELARF